MEVNTTFYNLPKPVTMEKWLRKVSGRNFSFSLKMPGEISHRLLLKEPEKAVESAAMFEREYVRLFEKSGKLGGVLIQLPPSFRIDESGKVYSLLRSLSTEEVRYYIEPRHFSLFGSDQFEAEIRELGADIAVIDGPQSILKKGSIKRKSSYFRLHGRNFSAWNKRNENPSERYSYSYTAPEIDDLSKRIVERSRSMDDVFIYFNNHPNGNAPNNAVMLADLLGVGIRDPQKKLM